jgi:hypothetical protein
MTPTALAPTPSLPPCVLAPDLWDSSDNTEAIAACRQHCPRRFACAQEALTGPKHLVSTLNGVIAGVAIPAQNEYGTSKAHKAALQRLKAIADSGRRVNAVAANPPHRSRPPSSEGDDQARTVQEAPIPGLNQTESNQPESRHETAQRRVLRLAPRTVEPRLGRDIPHGQFDVRDVARMTGLTEKHLRYLRSRGAGPKSWLNSSGGIRYWANDVDAWMASRADHGAEQSARAS